MKIGAMNHPAKDPVEEIRWMADLKLDFVDLTIEPPAAASWRLDVKAIRSALDQHGMDVVGHTAYYLPLCSPFEDIRRAAVEELKRCAKLFAALGAKWMNIHPDRHAPFQGRSYIIERNLATLRELLPTAREVGIGLMLENLPGDFNTVEQLRELLDPLPEIGLHLDIGHSNLLVPFNTADELIRHFGPRLKHVHLHDNKGGGADLHLPLGTGTVDTQRHLATLKRSGYDATITLEVFSPDRHYFEHSRDQLRRWWDEL